MRAHDGIKDALRDAVPVLPVRDVTFAAPDEVACLLGYQDTSSFYRAFRDWEGVTPNRWRELNGHAADIAIEPPRSFH